MGSRRDGWKQPFIASSKTSVITVVSFANLHGRWSAAGGAWRRRICLLWRVDIHILFLRFKRDWRPYRLYSTENEVISSVQQSASRSQRKLKNSTSWRASWSQITTASTENYETRNVDLSEDILGCPSCCQERRCRWVGPNSYRMFSWLTTEFT